MVVKKSNSVSTLSKALNYTKKSANQVIKGNYTNDVTLLGTAGEVALGFSGIDVAADARDIIYDIDNWETSWEHVGQTAVDVVGLVPIVGALKYTDEAAALVKGTSKAAKGAGKTVFKYKA